MSASIRDIRKEYASQSLDAADVLPDPIQQFQTWLEQALRAEQMEPTGFFLATSADNHPSGRVVLLKGVDHGFVFYTNYLSRKGSELKQNPAISATFWWSALERQVRIEGTVERVSQEESEEYFQSRPRGSQLGAHASPQSSEVADRQELEDNLVRVEKAYEGREVPKPEHWGGYRIIPTYIEFWQGRPNRLHDRITYRLVDGGWQIFRLAP